MAETNNNENNRVELLKEQLLSVADKPPRTEVILSQEDITFLCKSAAETKASNILGWSQARLGMIVG